MADITRDRIKPVPFVDELPDDTVKALLPEIREVKVLAQKRLSDGDKAATTFYYVESGRLKVEAHAPVGSKVSYRDVGKGEYLSLYPLFTGLPAEVEAQATEDSTLLAFPAEVLHRSLMSGVRREAYPRGEELFQQDQPAAFLYFILEGRVQLERKVAVSGGATQTVRRSVGPGEYLGRYALITSETYRATARTEQNATVLAIPFRTLQPLLFLHPGWREWFYPVEVAARLRAIPLFKSFEDWEIYLLSSEARLQEFKAQEVIYNADDAAEHFYVIDQGQVEEQPVSGEQSWYLASGNFFGDDSLTGGWRRKSMAVAIQPTRVFRLPGRMVAELIQQRGIRFDAQDTRGALLDRLRAVPVLGALPPERLRRLAAYVNLVYFRPGDTVARQGDVAEKLMILHEGEAVVLRQSGNERPRPVRRLHAQLGDPQGGRGAEYFGDRSLVGRDTRGATIEVTRPSMWIVLEKGDFDRFLQDNGLTEADLGKVSESDSAESKGADPLKTSPLPLPWRRRRHWIVALGNVLPGLLLALLMFGWLVATHDQENGGANVVFLLGRVFLLVFFLLWAVWGFLDWRNDIFEINSEAVLHIERELLTSEDRYEAPLHQIQNVNMEANVIGQLLKFGDVIIETAAARGRVVFTRIPDPQEAQSLIRRASDEAKAGRQVKEMESIRRRLEDRLAPERLNPEVPGSVLVEHPADAPAAAAPDVYRPRPFFIPPFEERRDGRIIWRKHWFNLFQRTGLPVVATGATGVGLLVIGVPVLARALGVDLPDVIDDVAQVWMVPVLLLAFALSTLWLKYKYEDWKNDIYVLSADQVIDQERKLAVFPIWWLYSENKRSAGLTNVQYVDLRIPNLLAIIFNYGDVIVRTAGATGQLDFTFVRNPRKVHATVLRRLTEFQERDRERQAEERRQDIARWLEAYHDVTRRGRVDG